ncbi:hypothetical protein N0V83_004787 [Neocucurbitaria cava]|uniref:RING-type domain-containing protein n=1 Tax=Neocucurbitaria cava TaxID=798079 RepID=A0A9W8Y975_9PLEO|nr:hypothetical protein N0V83_004787 [Neocucurbitaria cava]
MTVFASKTAFTTLGLAAIPPSHAHASQDCAICLQPLHLSPFQTDHYLPAGSNSHSHWVQQQTAHHPAVRILRCNHLLGTECLYAWLSVGNTCPVCKTLLFEAPREEQQQRQQQTITQRDVDEILRELGPVYGMDRVLRVLVGYLERGDLLGMGLIGGRGSGSGSGSATARGGAGAGGRGRQEGEHAADDEAEFMLRGEDFWDDETEEEEGDGAYEWDSDEEGEGEQSGVEEDDDDTLAGEEEEGDDDAEQVEDVENATAAAAAAAGDDKEEEDEETDWENED